MRITHEADYALRILSYLAKNKGIINAKQIAERCGISLNFTLKILNKLVAEELVCSHKGVNGGFELNVLPQNISFGQVIEAIDGPIEINHCLGCDFECTRVRDRKSCSMRKKFLHVNQSLKEELYKLRIEEI